MFFSETPNKNSATALTSGLPSFFSNMKKDDLILIGIILVLIGDGCEDKELLLILGLLFISDKVNLKDKLTIE